MKILAIDLGRRRSGVAFLDTDNGVPIALDPLSHDDYTDAVARITSLVHTKDIDHIVLGLPLLPSGDEGEQARFTRACGDVLRANGCDVLYIDERYTTPDHVLHGDTVAACSILDLVQNVGVDKLVK